MSESQDIEACKETILGYSKAINDWEIIQNILNRIENGQFITERQRKSIENTSLTAHNKSHIDIFNRFIVPGNRSYGSNPGEPKSWSNKGSFFNVDKQTIESVKIDSSNRAEVIANWGYMLPGGKTMFILKRIDQAWLIDSLKVSTGNKWEVAHL